MAIADQLWREDDGFIVSIELILLATIAVIGLIAGMAAVRDAVISELADVAGAIQDMNQCYSFFGIEGHSSSVCGSDFEDALDFCDSPDDEAAAADNCIVFEGTDDESGGEEGGGEGEGGGAGGGVIIGPPIVIGPPVIIRP